MKRFLLALCVAGLLLAAAAFIGTDRASAVFDPVPGWLAPSCDGQTSDDPFEEEDDCEVDTLSTAICVDGATYNVLNDDFLDILDMIDAINGVPGHSAVLGACPPAPLPGPSGIKLCNVGWPSDPPIIVPGFDPYNPGKGDPAKDAIATGQWRPADLVKGATKSFTCIRPTNAVPTGMVADDNDDEIPASLAAVYHAIGVGETFTYAVYTVS